jgi:hypothetical protein
VKIQWVDEDIIESVENSVIKQNPVSETRDIMLQWLATRVESVMWQYVTIKISALILLSWTSSRLQQGEDMIKAIFEG